MKSNEQRRRVIEVQVAEYLKRGGVIRQIPTGVSGNTEAHVLTERQRKSMEKNA